MFNTYLFVENVQKPAGKYFNDSNTVHIHCPLHKIDICQFNSCYHHHFCTLLHLVKHIKLSLFLCVGPFAKAGYCSLLVFFYLMYQILVTVTVSTQCSMRMSLSLAAHLTSSIDKATWYAVASSDQAVSEHVTSREHTKDCKLMMRLAWNMHSIARYTFLEATLDLNR